MTGTPVAEFTDPWEAELARHTLTDAGIEAWLEGSAPDLRLLGEGTGRLRLLVPVSHADEARDLLEEMAADREEELPDRRPAWVPLVAALVVVGLVWAAVPRFLWPWILLGGFAGYLVWRAVSPRVPR